jgi:hypothetical protein
VLSFVDRESFLRSSSIAMLRISTAILLSVAILYSLLIILLGVGLLVLSKYSFALL